MLTVRSAVSVMIPITIHIKIRHIFHIMQKEMPQNVFYYFGYLNSFTLQPADCEL